MKPKLYLETTIPSYLAAWHSRDIIIAGHQQITHDWWRRRRGHFQIFISQLVVDEAGDGDNEAASQRLAILTAMPKLDLNEDVGDLAAQFLTKGLIPKKSATDAAHIAVAAVHGMDFLMTWNCAHIANAEVSRRIAKLCLELGFTCPVICTPEELLGD